MRILYQFPISHFCEKVRWALDYKGLDYKVNNLLPGPHISKARKIAQYSSVPILKDGEDVIQGSDKIITYLDEKYPERSLTPENAGEKKQALEWEKYLDTEIGVHVRRACYHILLDHPDIVIPFFTHKGPWYGALLMRVIFPKLQHKMRTLMNINESSAQESLEHLHVAIGKVNKEYSEREFLVSDKFTRADLASAALLAPLCQPQEYGLSWPEKLPREMNELVEKLAPEMQWVLPRYAKFR